MVWIVCLCAAGCGKGLEFRSQTATNQDLKLFQRRDGSWGKPKTVDSADHVGRQVSAALGPDGALHLSH